MEVMSVVDCGGAWRVGLGWAGLGWAGLGRAGLYIGLRYGWVVVREGGRREEGKEVWDGVLFCFVLGIEKERVGRVWEGLIHLVGGGRVRGCCGWVGSGVEGGMLMVCSLGVV